MKLSDAKYSDADNTRRPINQTHIKTVKQYVIVNLFFLSIVTAITLFYSFTQPLNGADKALFELSTSKDYLIVIAVILITTLLIVGFCLLIYFLLYGLLMRKLNRNYNELKKLEL